MNRLSRVSFLRPHVLTLEKVLVTMHIPFCLLMCCRCLSPPQDIDSVKQEGPMRTWA